MKVLATALASLLTVPQFAACGGDTRARHDARPDATDFGCHDRAALNFQRHEINGGRCLFGGEIVGLLGATFEDAFTEEELFGFARAYGELDADEDGCLTRSEFEEAGEAFTDVAAAHRAADADLDECLSADEWFVHRVTTAEGRGIFASLDTSGDGLLQRGEHHGALPYDATTLDFIYGLWAGVGAASGSGTSVVPEEDFLLVYSRWSRDRYPRPSPMWTAR
jgi:Ca2+-binding EF-hand superfamily protein